MPHQSRVHRRYRIRPLYSRPDLRKCELGYVQWTLETLASLVCQGFGNLVYDLKSIVVRRP